MIKGCRSIAEYAISKWLRNENFDLGYFDLLMEGDEAILKDGTGDSMRLMYDRKTGCVYVQE